MKLIYALKSFGLTLVLALLSIVSFAQEEGTTVSTTTTSTSSETFTPAPWMWIVGGALLLLLLVALLRPKKTGDSVTVTRTVDRD